MQHTPKHAALGFLAAALVWAGCAHEWTTDEEKEDDAGLEDDAGTDDADPPEDATVGEETTPADDAGVTDAGSRDETSDDADEATDAGGDCGPIGELTWNIVDLGVGAVAYDIARDNLGGKHLLRKDGGALHYGRFDDGSVTGDVVLPGSDSVVTTFARPRVAVRPDGSAVHTCWANAGPTRADRLYHAWRDAAGTWRREVAWQSPAGSPRRAAVPAVGVDADGTVHVIAQFWDDCFVSGCVPTEYSVAYASRPVGGIWSDWEPLYSGAREMRHCSIFTDPDGGIHATWKGWRLDGAYRYAAAAGGLADAPTIGIPIAPGAVSAGMGDSFAPVDGTVHHAHVSFDTRSIDYARLDPGGGRFEWQGTPSGGPVPSASDFDPWPAIVADECGRVVVAWAGQTGALGASRLDQLQTAVLDDGTWTVQTVDSAADIPKTGKPALTITGNTVWMVWRGDGGNLRLATARL
ncbi:MAG: hypothetical protein JXB32_01795 [Deltaproteobacteria bacterium]|nr:hypothetical protein [Deltaproteobacteria bacterium]